MTTAAFFYGTGRRKTAVARVRLVPGSGEIVVNAGKIHVTSAKRETKLYMRHSGYPHGLKAESLGHLLDRRPEEVIRRAVKGMLPHNRLGAQQLTKLKIYAGPEHPHQAQRPEPLA